MHALKSMIFFRIAQTHSFVFGMWHLPSPRHIQNILHDRLALYQSINQSNPNFFQKQALIIPHSEGVAWLPSLDLNRPLQTFRSFGSTKLMLELVRSFCKTTSQVCFGLPFPFLPSISSFCTWLIQPELHTTWPSHLSLQLRSTPSIFVILSFSKRLS